MGLLESVPRKLPPLHRQVLHARGLVAVPFITARMATEAKPDAPLDPGAGRCPFDDLLPENWTVQD